MLTYEPTCASSNKICRAQLWEKSRVSLLIFLGVCEYFSTCSPCVCMSPIDCVGVCVQSQDERHLPLKCMSCVDGCHSTALHPACKPDDQVRSDGITVKQDRQRFFHSKQSELRVRRRVGSQSEQTPLQ